MEDSEEARNWGSSGNPFHAAALLNPLGLQHLQHRQQQHLSSDSMIEGGSEGKGGGAAEAGASSNGGRGRSQFTPTPLPEEEESLSLSSSSFSLSRRRPSLS